MTMVFAGHQQDHFPSSEWSSLGLFPTSPLVAAPPHAHPDSRRFSIAPLSVTIAPFHPGGIVPYKAILVLSICALITPAFARQSSGLPPNRRLENAAASFREIMATPDKGIPTDLFDKSQCIIIIPGLKKGAFIWGGKYGRGYASCRQSDRSWSGPAAVGIEGGSFGFQLGGSSTDVIMLVMNQSGMRALLSNKFTLGGEAAAAAGPVGRNTSANTDILATAGILSWSRSRGLFAGISLEGATLHADGNENLKLYGKAANNRDILMGEVTAPSYADALTCALDEFTPGANSPCGSSTARALAATGRASLSEVRFATAKADILPESEAALTQAADALRAHPSWKIRVEGYTDNTGDPVSNQDLSERRAAAVLDWLVKHDVSPSRLSAQGYGAGNPVADNATPEGRAQNRRVELVRLP
jgi:lipid-binding SYLF domain-containing protein